MTRFGWLAVVVALPGVAGASALPRVITPAGVQASPSGVRMPPARVLAAQPPVLAAPDGPVAPLPAVVAGLNSQAAQPRGFAGGPGQRDALLALVRDEATRQGVPPELADAVAVVETGYTPDAIGSSGEIGLMQVMPGTAALLGFHGSMTELAAPATNIHYGVAYLARAWQAAGGNPCRALMKYRAGVGEDGYSPLSLSYCRHAATWLATLQSPLADQLGATIPAEATIADRGGGGLMTAHAGTIDLHQIAVLADMPDMVIEDAEGRPLRAAMVAPRQQLSAAARPARLGAARQADVQAIVQAAVDAALADTDSDRHVVHMPSSPE